MADEPVVNEGAEAPKSEAQTPPPVTTKPEGEGTDWWQEAQGRGFKEQGAVWKSYREAEKKITEQAEALKTSQKFELEVAPVLNAIWEDEELLSAVRNKMNGTPDNTKPIKKETSNKEPSQPQYDPEARSVLQSQILADFEKSKGIDSLDDDSRKQVRNMIGQEMVKWLPNRKEVPLNKMREYLEDAYIVAKGKHKEFDSIVKPVTQSVDEGAFPSTTSGGITQSGRITLTADQKKTASKMGLTEEAYTEGLKKLLQK